MSKFQRDYDEWREKMLRESEGTPMTYPMMRSMGMLKPYTFRLPPHTLAMIDEMERMGGPWDTKAEMLYMIVQGAIDDFLSDAHESIQERFRKASEKALKDWQAEIEERGQLIVVGGSKEGIE